MKPKYKIVADGRDITDKIKQRFVSLSYSDNSGFQNDRITLVLDDRPPQLKLSELSTNLEVWMGYEKDPDYEAGYQQFVLMGSFYVDEFQIDRKPVRTLTVIARANDTGGTLKTVKTRSWDTTTFGEMVTQIAQEHSLEPRVHSDYSSIEIDHLDQTNQSDQGFLTMLANKNNAVFKVVNDKLFFAPRGATKALNGAEIPVIEIDESELENYTVTIQQRSNHKTVTTRHYDTDAAEEKIQTVEAESSNGVETESQVEEIAPTEAEALTSAQAKSGQLNREKETFNFSMVGLPVVRAEAKVRIANFRSELRDTWLVKTATHSISRSGYKLTVNCETPED